MSGEPQQTPKRETLVSYNVRTTHIISGLPFTDQQQLLKKYRSLFHERDEPVPVVPGVWHTAMRNHHDVNTSYDLSCQYLRNVHAMEQKGTHTDSDEEADDDSLFSSDDEMPPLEEATPSTGAPSPVLVPVLPDTWGTGASDNANVTDANANVNDANTANAANAAANVNDANAAANDDAKATADADDANADPPVPDLHPWSSSARWKNYWQSIRTLQNRGHQDGEYGERAWSHTDGEGIERAWGEANTLPSSARQMGPGFRRTTIDGTSEIHHIRIVSSYGVRDVSCDCTDNLHTVYEDRRAYAFLDMDGNVMNDVSIDYEVRPEETSRDTGIYATQDGRRQVRRGINVAVKKRKIAPSDLTDLYGDWMPLPGDAEEWRAGADDDEQGAAETGEKRKRYESSVRVLRLI
ncbi:hypothetical protein DFH06DRAFT_1127668 [Mycena polygramma]|nr:hypothetical protein DFH06DRAFT_1127668 [Mycena polygramma]